MKVISVVVPCYNEEGNIEKVYGCIKEIFDNLQDYTYEFVFIDNCSNDGTVNKLRNIASIDKQVKVILNSRNFGYVRSSFHGLIQATGDGVVFIHADLQEDHNIIPAFIEKWEQGYEIVVGVKNKSDENPVVHMIRTFGYKVIEKLSNIEQISHFTGFGFYDKKVIEILRSLKEPYPYLRGIISEIGHKKAIIEYEQRCRTSGDSKFNFYNLYDLAIIGIVNYSKVPLRFALFGGIVFAFLSLVGVFGVLIAKMILGAGFNMMQLLLMSGLFFFASLQLFFMGIIGEYLSTIQINVLNRPLVFEKERINFD